MDLSPTLLNRLQTPRLRNVAGVVIVIDAGYFIRREVFRAFRRCGWQVVSLPVQPREGYIERLLNMILEHRPDFLFTVNHFGFDEDGVVKDLLLRIELPFVSWFVDSPAFVLLDHKANVSPLALTAIWERTYIPFLKEFGFDNIIHLPLAGDPVSMRKGDNCQAHYNVSFVGDSIRKLAAQWLQMCPTTHDLQMRLDAAVNALLTSSPLKSPLWINETEPDGFALEEWMPRARLSFASAAVLEATRRYRWKAIRALSEMQIDVFGDEDWINVDSANDGDFLLSPSSSNLRWHPTVDYYRELPEVYAATEVNLNFSHFQMPTGVNQRVFDAPLSGGFLLTDKREDLEVLFKADEYAVFDSLDEISEKVKFFKRQDGLKRSIADAAAEHILKEHTYEHRIRTVITEIKRIYRTLT